jgi:hypothetical protein
MKKTFLTIFPAILVFAPLISLAAGLVPCGGQGEQPCQFCDFFVLFDNIVDFLLIKIVPPLAALMIAIGGVVYLVSRADPEMLSLARRIFTSVVYGLLIIYSAFLIIGIFFWLIGLSTWTYDIYHNWWQEGFFQVNCSIPAPATNNQQQQ